MKTSWNIFFGLRYLKKYWLWGAFSLWAFNTEGQVPVFRVHKPEIWGQVKASVIFQDNIGWFWIGTEDGVFRYDGLVYDYFRLPDSLKNQQGVRSIAEKSGEIWVGFNSGLMAKVTYSGFHSNDYSQSIDIFNYRQGLLQVWSPEEGTPQVPITKMVAAPSGIFWIATYGEGVYADTGKRLFQFNAADDGLTGDEIYDMVCDNDGNVWLATDAGISVCQLTGDGRKTVWTIGIGDGLTDEIVTNLQKDAFGNIWIGTHDGGICKYDFSKKRIETPFAHPFLGEVKRIAIYDRYEIWFNTGSGDLYRGDLYTGTIHRVEALFPDKQFRIKEILRDREGLLWFLGHQGQVLSANMHLLKLETPFQSVQAICSDSQGQLWVGTESGLFVFQNNTWKPIIPAKINVISLAQAANGDIWAGTFGEGVFIFSPTGALTGRLTTAQGLPNGSILSLTALEDQMWLTTLGGIVSVKTSNLKVVGFEAISGNATASKYYVYKIFTDSKGRLWFCTDGYGLCMWDNQQFRCFNKVAETPLKTIYSITEDQYGHIWFSGDQTGLIVFDGEKIRRFSTEDHLHSTQINSLSTTGEGQVIVGYNDGIDIITPGTFHIAFVSESSGAVLAETNLNAACASNSGHVWLGTTKGVVRVSAFAQQFAHDPGTLIKSVSNDLELIDIHQNGQFSYDENNLIFEYAGIWHTNPNAVYFRYQLEGFDPRWKISKDRLASYPNLPPGNYRFRVQSSEHGRFEDTPEAVYTFTIRGPFWASWWFITLAMVVLWAVVRAYIKNRENRLQREQEMKNEKIAAQLEALKTQINPHFLFNSLNTLIAIIEENRDLAVDYVQHLADFYRSIMVYRERDFIDLQEEKEIAGNFGFLLKKRFEDALQIDIRLQGQNGLIMPLTLQMLIENAVKHNIISKKHILVIEIFVEDNAYIVVKNTRNLKIKPEPGTRYGLQSLSHRYEVLTGKKVIILQENGCFTVKVPLVNDRLA